MIIKNTLSKEFIVLLDGKEYKFAPGTSMEVSDREGEFLMMLQPLLTSPKEEVLAKPVKSVVIKSKPAKIEKKASKPKAKKDVVKNKKSRK